MMHLTHSRPPGGRDMTSQSGLKKNISLDSSHQSDTHTHKQTGRERHSRETDLEIEIEKSMCR